MKIRALKPFRYASRARQPGEVFEAIDRDAKLLKRVGRAADHIEPEPVAAAAVEPAPPAAAPAAVEPLLPVKEVEEQGPSRPVGAMRYRRRDMTAAEE